MTGKGIESTNRVRLDRLHRELGRPFAVADAAETLHLPADKTRRLLAQFAERGWLSRIRRNAYALVPLGASKPGEWREDPWCAAATAFAPCYLGGWTAGEHWSLTEQLFRDIIVFSSRRVHERVVVLQGTTFRVKRISPKNFFGLQTVWRGQSRISVSDPSRTLVDLLDDPSVGGGIRHVSEMVAAYFAGDSRDDAKLIDYVPRLGNRTVWKRLGFLVETLGISAPELVDVAQKSLSKGLSLLDPAGPKSGRVLKRWNLRVNLAFERNAP